METANTLKQVFGYEGFREGQEDIINNILSGRDCLCIMPTGAGKSLCFQLPSLLFTGVTLVISPLISLMKDQVQALRQLGVPAAYINSSLSEEHMRLVQSNLGKGRYKIIYVAPERLEAISFLRVCSQIDISMITVDEAHCISQWGQDFRPSYLKIPAFIESLPVRPVVAAFTATASPTVREDIKELLYLQDPLVMVSGFDRKNLFLGVTHTDDKFSSLMKLIQGYTGMSGIVYCSTRSTVEEVCRKLIRANISATRYHAGLDRSERQQNQEAFIYDKAHVMVATNAFGMGIDKSNVRFVVHYNMPMDIESYYQEAGRAGRDGEPAECILLYSPQDVRTNQWLIENSRDAADLDPKAIKALKERNHQRLKEMTWYCHTRDCLRGYILRYFGERPPSFCGNCSNCKSNFSLANITIEAQKIISCILRSKERFGTKMIIDILRGAKVKRIREQNLDKLSTYGISILSEARLREIIHHLVYEGYLEVSSGEYPVLRRGPRSAELLDKSACIEMKLLDEVAPQPVRSGAASRRDLRDESTALFEKLRALRHDIAKEQGVPAFVVFSDSTLIDMCRKKPISLLEFLQVSGVGKVKQMMYGESFLSAITEYISNSDQVAEP